MHELTGPSGARRIFGESHEPAIAVEAHIIEPQSDQLSKLDRRSPAADVVRAAFATSVERLVRFDAALRLEPTPERVHAARVCVRRLRSHLRSFRPLMHRIWSKRVRERLSWLDEVLSTARDADVLVARIAQRAPDGDRRDLEILLEPLLRRRSAAYAALDEALRSLQYRNLIEALAAAARAPQFMPCAYRRARPRLATVMQPAWRRLRQAVRRAGPVPNDRDLHRIRRRAREVRYAAEALVPVARRAARRLAKHAEDLQTLLGEQHDAVVAYAALQTQAATPRAAALAGEIAALEVAVVAACRKRWRRCWKRLARRTPRFW